MRTEVDNYRGWQIFFDTDTEKFTAYSNIHDSEIEKGSYPAVKKGIDDFIKENETFKPITIVSTSAYRNYASHKNAKFKIIGIRKDGAFVYEDSQGKKHQLSKYDEKNYMLYDEKNDAVFAEYDKMKLEASRIIERANVYLKENIIEKTITIYRKELGYEEN
jgi:hypothetical protein